MRIYEARSEIFLYKNSGKLQATVSIIGNIMTNPTSTIVRVATAAGTQILKITIGNGRLQIAVDETALGTDSDDRLQITVNDNQVSVAPEAIVVLTAYSLDLTDNSGLNLG